jgi:hypothetical protein
MAYNVIPAACTNPNAMFYHADLALLDILHAYGIDMPCDLMVAFGALAVGVITALAMALVYAVWYLWTYAERNDPYGLKRHAKARSKAHKRTMTQDAKRQKARDDFYDRQDRAFEAKWKNRKLFS